MSAPVTMKRLSASTAGLGAYCAYSFRSDVQKEPFIPQVHTLMGNAFDDAVQLYPRSPDWVSLLSDAVGRENEVLVKAVGTGAKAIRLQPAQAKSVRTKYDHWRKWADVHYPDDALVEQVIAYDPVIDAARLLPGKFPKTSPGEWFIREDLISPALGTHWNWKVGHKLVEHPSTNWQFKATRVAMAAIREWALDEVTSVLFQVSDTGYRNPAPTFKKAQLDTEREQMARISLKMVPDAKPSYGAHCDDKYCPSRKYCPEYLAKAEEREAAKREAAAQAAMDEDEADGEPARTTTTRSTVSMSVKPVSQSRMSLSRGRKGIIESPLRVVLYGVEGVGKSFFAASFPKAKWLSAERGTEHLDVDRFEEPQSWDDVLDAINALLTEPHDYQTFVIDPANWIEPLAWAKVCKDNGWSDIEQPGFGKGYAAAVSLWRDLTARLDRLRDERKMHVVIVAHSEVKQQKSPDTDDYERYQLALNKNAAAVVKQWADIVGFMRFELSVNRVNVNPKDKRAKGTSSGARALHVRWHAAWDAKNRFNLPGDLYEPTWASLSKAIAEGRRTPETVIAEIQSLLAEINIAETTANVHAWIAETDNKIGPLCDVLEAVKHKHQTVSGEAA